MLVRLQKCVRTQFKKKTLPPCTLLANTLPPGVCMSFMDAPEFPICTYVLVDRYVNVLVTSVSIYRGATI